jgi:hypothetical protein
MADASPAAAGMKQACTQRYFSIDADAKGVPGDHAALHEQADRVLSVSDVALRDGCDRARDLFHLARLDDPHDAAARIHAVFEAFGVGSRDRRRLERAMLDLVPVEGAPLVEATLAASMLSGVLVGLLIADSALPADELDLPVRAA